MKRILAALVIVIISANAAHSMELKDYNVFYKLSDQGTFKSLVRYLNVDSEQADQLKYIFNLTERKLNYANRKSSTVAAERAMFFNLGNVKYLLSEEQYRKYLIVLNVSRFSDYESNFADNK
jgi:uncharacterized membrane protein